MASIRTTFVVIGVIIVILVGSALGLTLLQGKATTTVNGITSSAGLKISVESPRTISRRTCIVLNWRITLLSCEICRESWHLPCILDIQ